MKIWRFPVKTTLGEPVRWMDRSASPGSLELLSVFEANPTRDGSRDESPGVPCQVLKVTRLGSGSVLPAPSWPHWSC